MIAYNFKHKLFLLAIFCLGMGIALFLTRMNIPKGGRGVYFSLERLFPNGGHLVNPLLGVETSQGNDVRLESAKYSIGQYITTSIEGRSASSIAVYLRDLNNGTWIGINEEEKFAAASLDKIPLMIAYLKKAEQDPAILSKMIKYEAKIDVLPQNIPPQNSVKLGNAYTAEELLRYMIEYSDNIAMALLFENIGEKVIAEVCSDLQLPTIALRGPEWRMSAKDYAVLFRILYSATYLNNDSSEKALGLLTATEFREGIIAGIPPGITVAHKFAERAYSQGSEKQLHDCGIVYYEKRPYLICIMTKGWDFNVLKGVIREISRIAYEHMTQKIVIY